MTHFLHINEVLEIYRLYLKWAKVRLIHVILLAMMYNILIDWWVLRILFSLSFPDRHIYNLLFYFYFSFLFNSHSCETLMKFFDELNTMWQLTLLRHLFELLSLPYYLSSMRGGLIYYVSAAIFKELKFDE